MNETKPLPFVIDIEMSFTLEDITDLRRLADKLGTSTEETARSCMMHRCKEQLALIAKQGNALEEEIAGTA